MNAFDECYLVNIKTKLNHIKLNNLNATYEMLMHDFVS